MLWVKLGTHITDHERLLEAGAVARDLYVWGLLYAGKHETDGELPMSAVLASPWGANGTRNIKPALRLVEVGLWLRTSLGFSSCRWAEQGNETKASLAEKRTSAKDRKTRFANEKVRRSEQRTNAFGSTSTSLSDLDLSQIASTAELPAEAVSEVRARVLAPESSAGDLTPELRMVVAQVCEPNLVTLDADLEWTTYVAHCGKTGTYVTPAGWKYWLCNAAKFAKRDRIREAARGSPGGRHVQSANNRAWIVPKDMP